MENRKGARSIKDIPEGVLAMLNKGELSSVNLTEWLAIDQRQLVQYVLLDLKKDMYTSIVLDAIESIKKPTVNSINQCIGYTLYCLAKENEDRELFELLKKHKSDLVRCWATYFIGYNDALSINEKLEEIKYFAGDGHFGVREICWMAVRADIIDKLDESITILLTWTKDENEYIRRFVTESTRPRGVWCKHIDRLKENPEVGLPLLEALKEDSSKYVMDSVGNWLNDAAKTQPAFVLEVCDKWEKQNNSKGIQYIIKKAKRSL
ncbi:DNA alkylation repair protein [Myroides profundi]|uniref:DNA alkylation repair enzyme n=1 Tax=Myroides profundi TaxID=480520 RepID=A0AAJ5BEZ6_MYRPR|nr:DNA alkylation repair protein [Myroides profundi]AJH16164.1 3-methyladenine DNA glycosylase AlkC [Myroides profundi]SER36979.1 DNA alkylation repair enzyme [Myroides profundi]